MNKWNTPSKFKRIMAEIYPFLIVMFVLFCVLCVKAQKKVDETNARFQQQEAQRKHDQEFNEKLQQTLKNIEEYERTHWNIE